MFDKMELKEEILDDLQVAEKNWTKLIDKAKTVSFINFSKFNWNF